MKTITPVQIIEEHFMTRKTTTPQHSLLGFTIGYGAEKNDLQVQAHDMKQTFMQANTATYMCSVAAIKLSSTCPNARLHQPSVAEALQISFPQAVENSMP